MPVEVQRAWLPTSGRLHGRVDSSHWARALLKVSQADRFAQASRLVAWPWAISGDGGAVAVPDHSARWCARSIRAVPRGPVGPPDLRPSAGCLTRRRRAVGDLSAGGSSPGHSPTCSASHMETTSSRRRDVSHQSQYQLPRARSGLSLATAQTALTDHTMSIRARRPGLGGSTPRQACGQASFASAQNPGIDDSLGAGTQANVEASGLLPTGSGASREVSAWSRSVCQACICWSAAHGTTPPGRSASPSVR